MCKWGRHEQEERHQTRRPGTRWTARTARHHTAGEKNQEPQMWVKFIYRHVSECRSMCSWCLIANIVLSCLRGSQFNKTKVFGLHCAMTSLSQLEKYWHNFVEPFGDKMHIETFIINVKIIVVIFICSEFKIVGTPTINMWWNVTWSKSSTVSPRVLAKDFHGYLVKS